MECEQDVTGDSPPGTPTGEAAGLAPNRAALLTPMGAIGELPAFSVRGAEGVSLFLEDGRRVLDAGSTSACLLGHCHPEVVAAIERAARGPSIDCTTGYKPREDAAEDLIRLAFAGEPWAETAVFFVSASEACDLGLVLAQTLTGREAIVSRTGKYHGSSGLARTASPESLAGGHLLDGTERKIASQPPAVRWLPRPSCERNYTDPDHHSCEEDCLRSAPVLLNGAAAVLTENSPYGGFPLYAYQDVLADMAREAGVLWIADETVTGFGRTGRWFSFQAATRRPDFVQLGKGLTGGAAPGGALVLSRSMADAMGNRRWCTAGTYRGHPLTVAAISAVLRVIQRDGLVSEAATRGRTIAKRLQEIAAGHECVEAVRGEGLMWAVAMSGPAGVPHAPATADQHDEPLVDLVRRRSLELGVRFGLDLDGSLWLVPPLIVSERDVELICEVLDAALDVGDKELKARHLSSV